MEILNNISEKLSFIEDISFLGFLLSNLLTCLAILIFFIGSRNLIKKLIIKKTSLILSFSDTKIKEAFLKSMENWTTLDDNGFIKKLDELGGLHPDIAANDELVELLLPILRADISIVEHYAPDNETTAPCPVTIFGGHSDTNIPMDTLEQWQECFAQPIQIEMLEAGHFYLDTHAQHLSDHIAEICKSHLEK